MRYSSLLPFSILGIGLVFTQPGYGASLGNDPTGGQTATVFEFDQQLVTFGAGAFSEIEGQIGSFGQSFTLVEEGELESFSLDIGYGKSEVSDDSRLAFSQFSDIQVGLDLFDETGGLISTATNEVTLNSGAGVQTHEFSFNNPTLAANTEYAALLNLDSLFTQIQNIDPTLITTTGDSIEDRRLIGSLSAGLGTAYDGGSLVTRNSQNVTRAALNVDPSVSTNDLLTSEFNTFVNVLETTYDGADLFNEPTQDLAFSIRIAKGDEFGGTEIPEPTSWLGFGGLVLLGGRALRRRHRF